MPWQLPSPEFPTFFSDALLQVWEGGEGGKEMLNILHRFIYLPCVGIKQ